MLRCFLQHKELPRQATRAVVTIVQPPPKQYFTVVKAVQEVLKGAEAKPRKFVESVEVALVMRADPRKSNQVIRGTASLPHGTGKPVRVAVFAGGTDAEAAKAAGADVVGLDDLAEQIQAGDLDFQRVLATPDGVGAAQKLARLLGPRGIMPNVKQNTVREDIAQAVSAAKAGEILFRTKKTPEITAAIGKINFGEDKIMDNLRAFMMAVQDAKPEGVTGRQYIKSATLSSTVGKGFRVRVDTIDPRSPKFMQDRE